MNIDEVVRESDLYFKINIKKIGNWERERIVVHRSYVGLKNYEKAGRSIVIVPNQLEPNFQYNKDLYLQNVKVKRY